MHAGESPDVTEHDDLGRAHSTEDSLVSRTNLTLHLVKPEAADPRVRRIFDDTRRTLHLPWIGALFQAYALYPDYLEMAWHELRPALGTRQFAADATAIGNAADQAVARFYTPSYSSRDVAAMNLNLPAIRETINAFHAGNPKLLLVATALQRAFEEGPIGGGTGLLRPVKEPGETEEERVERATVEMVDDDEASEAVTILYADIQATLGLPLVNSDYRAMALWPDYLTLAWRDIKAHIHTADYETEVRRLSGLAREGVDRFAVPVGATREAAQRAGVPADQLDNLGAILRLFAGLLPGLILNVAMFYRAIA
jgi:hypothetical protein